MLLLLRQVIDCIEWTVEGLWVLDCKKSVFSVLSAMHYALLWSCVGTVTGRWMSRHLQGDIFLLLMIIIVAIRAHTGCATWTPSYCRASLLEQSP